MAYFGMRGWRDIPPVVKNLLIANVLLFVAQKTFTFEFTYRLALLYPENPFFGVWQVVTYMFLHADFFHILFNMFALYVFGSTLEDLWGAKRFVIFYFICGIGAGLVQLMTNKIEFMILNNQIQNGSISMEFAQEKARSIIQGYTIGASGAIMGIFAGFAYLFPNTPLYLFMLPIPIKAKYLLTGLILLDVFGGINPRTTSGIAHFAHIGGAFIGLLLVYIMNKNNRRNFY